MGVCLRECVRVVVRGPFTGRCPDLMSIRGVNFKPKLRLIIQLSQSNYHFQLAPFYIWTSKAEAT